MVPPTEISTGIFTTASESEHKRIVRSEAVYEKVLIKRFHSTLSAGHAVY
jgi:hypothetical protein